MCTQSSLLDVTPMRSRQRILFWLNQSQRNGPHDQLWNIANAQFFFGFLDCDWSAVWILVIHWLKFCWQCYFQISCFTKFCCSSFFCNILEHHSTWCDNLKGNIHVIKLKDRTECSHGQETLKIVNHIWHQNIKWKSIRGLKQDNTDLVLNRAASFQTRCLHHVGSDQDLFSTLWALSSSIPPVSLAVKAKLK